MSEARQERPHARSAADDVREGRWTRLLTWLSTEHGMDVGPAGLRVECRAAKDAGNGLFAVDDCPPSSVLFTVPTNAMINVKTLSLLYPTVNSGPGLSANQIVSMHLLLHRPMGEEDSLDPKFGPFISTMPRDFDSHPVTWTVRYRLYPSESYWSALCQSLSPGVERALQNATARFWEDWNAVCSYLSTYPAIISCSSRPDRLTLDVRRDNDALVEDYLWAWLNVNTRCIYYSLDPNQAAPCNFTLCPILDFANHRPEHTHIAPMLTSNKTPAPGSRKHGAALGGDYVFKASNEALIRKDDELFLRYGGHFNKKLFVEYGFVNTWKLEECASGEFSGEVDVQEVVETLFESRGSVGAWMKNILEEEGYWGDWTLHSSPIPAHPSYRLITVLRLYHAVVVGSEAVSADADERVEGWRNVITGQSEILSDDNETAWRSTTVAICTDIVDRAWRGLEELEATVSTMLAKSQGPPWLGWMFNNIRLLWREDLEVASAVIRSVQSGEDF